MKSNHNAERKKILRFQHIYLENWRNFEKVDQEVQKRVFLFGPNASGKSNFLDAFRFLHDITPMAGGFWKAVKKEGREGISTLRALAARGKSDITIRVAVGSDEKPNAWKYEIMFNEGADHEPVLKKETVWREDEKILDRPDSKDDQDSKRLTQTFLEQVSANENFRELVDFFSSIRYLHIVPQLVRDPDRSVGRKQDPYGGDFLEIIAKTGERERSAMLRVIKEALSVALPQLTEVEFWRDNERGTPHLRGKYKHWRPQGAWQNEKHFSDGTLRLFGLLWAILDGNGPLLLEEPELSLHPEIIRHLPQLFARIQRKTGRQILLSSHSAELLSDGGIGLDEVLLLRPQLESTNVEAVNSRKEIVAMLKKGGSLEDVVFAQTRPAHAEQMTFFMDGFNE